jgi:site-specific DNA-methyltransferase (adenine-specific)
MQNLSSSKPSIDLYNEDCLKGMKERLTDKSVSVIVTSPPYNLGIDYGTEEYNDWMPRQKYLDWMLDISCEMHRVLSDRGSLFLNLGSKPTDPYVPHDVLDIFRRSWYLQNTFLWVKSLYVEEIETTVGHFKPINSPRFVNDCVEFIYQLGKTENNDDQGFEYMFHMTKDGKVPVDRMALGVPYEDESNRKRWKQGGLGLHCRGNVWVIPYKTIQSRDEDRGGHPATFPPQLAMNCMLTHGVERIKLVLDPFAGLGNTAIAASELGVNFVGFELVEQIYNNALKKVGET